MAYDLTAVLTLRDNFSRQMNGALRSMQTMERNTRTTSASMSNLRNVGRSTFSGLASTIGETAAKLGLVAGAAGAVGLAFSGIQKAMDFESQMSTIKALTGASAAEMKKMTDLAMEMGAKTKYSALEAGQGIEELLKAGLTPAQVKAGGLEAALNLATAGGLDLAKASEIMSTALNAFKDDAMSASDAANILAGTANASATSVEELQYGIAQVGAVASGIGMSFKDVNIAMGLFANNGLKGSDAGTSLKTMLSNLEPKTKKANEAMMDLGIVTRDGANAFYDSQGNIKSMASIAGTLKESMKGLTAQQRQVYLYSMFGSDAIRAGNILFKEGAEGVKKFTSEMSKVTALDVAKEKMNNAAGAVEQFKGALETFQIAVLTPLMPLIKEAALNMANFIGNLKPEQIKSFSDTIKNGFQTAYDITSKLAKFIIDNWPLIRESIIGVTTAVITFRSAMAALTIIQTINTLLAAYRAGTLLATAAQLGFNVALLANPIGLVIAAISALIAVGVLLYRNWDTVRAKAQQLWSKFGSLITKILAFSGPIGQLVAGGIKLCQNWDKVKAVGTAAFNAIGNVIDKVKGRFHAFTSAVSSFKMPNFKMPSMASTKAGMGPSKSKSKKNKSSYHGESYVPRNGMMYRLHQGERVLTKKENRQFSKGTGGGVTINLNGTTIREDADVDKLASALARQIYLAGEAGA
ncbi:phage tail tape measure protein [Priestia megaterium]|uniref:phage tail tape measure protein n=1 Tax=Priestia megaterium TaxID=1404 RepID=UPI000BFBA81E|nr:phage tail tape measure protein [Priestia megaterium]PGN53928.1 phage tail tape measure protein [Priestia megaterium]